MQLLQGRALTMGLGTAPNWGFVGEYFANIIIFMAKISHVRMSRSTSCSRLHLLASPGFFKQKWNIRTPMSMDKDLNCPSTWQAFTQNLDSFETLA